MPESSKKLDRSQQDEISQLVSELPSARVPQDYEHIAELGDDDIEFIGQEQESIATTARRQAGEAAKELRPTEHGRTSQETARTFTEEVAAIENEYASKIAPLRREIEKYRSLESQGTIMKDFFASTKRVFEMRLRLVEDSLATAVEEARLRFEREARLNAMQKHVGAYDRRVGDINAEFETVGGSELRELNDHLDQIGKNPAMAKIYDARLKELALALEPARRKRDTALAIAAREFEESTKTLAPSEPSAREVVAVLHRQFENDTRPIMKKVQEYTRFTGASPTERARAEKKVEALLQIVLTMAAARDRAIGEAKAMFSSEGSIAVNPEADHSLRTTLRPGEAPLAERKTEPSLRQVVGQTLPPLRPTRRVEPLQRIDDQKPQTKAA